MKRKNLLFYNVSILLFVFSSGITSVFAGFRIGDSSVPVDEGDFLEYDFDDNVASGPSRFKVEFVRLYQHYDVINSLGVNITVSELISSSNTYDVLIVDYIEYQNQTCLLYNKTNQFFRYEQCMNNLLMEGYGGYYIIPNDPVDLYIVKGFIENYTIWSANVINDTITIYIANIQAVLTYNQQGILIKEEIKSNNVTISTLSLIETGGTDDSNFVLFVSITVIIAIIAVLISIGIILYKKSR